MNKIAIRGKFFMQVLYKKKAGKTGLFKLNYY